MKDYNPVSMVLNMPCQYIQLDEDKSNSNTAEVLVGHFAFYDEEGYGYVWGVGGTSYTRACSFENTLTIKEYIDSQMKYGTVVKCAYVFPLSSNVYEYHRHQQLVNLLKCH